MSVLVNFRIEEKLKRDMEKMCKKLGITMSAAFNMFAKNLVNSGSINFSLNKKLKSGIDYKHFYERLSVDSESVAVENDTDVLDNDLIQNYGYHMNKIGNVIMLVPKDDPWAGIRDSAGNMSDDFMTSRDQMQVEERENL